MPAVKQYNDLTEKEYGKLVQMTNDTIDHILDGNFTLTYKIINSTRCLFLTYDKHVANSYWMEYIVNHFMDIGYEIKTKDTLINSMSIKQLFMELYKSRRVTNEV